jgi:hypothetical protein
MAAMRDEKGRFVKGHPDAAKGAKRGRPKRPTEERYLKAMTQCVTVDDWKKVIHTAVARAKAGDGQARQWLSDYLIGKPTQRVLADVTTAGESLNARYDEQQRARTLLTLIDALRAGMSAGDT